MSTHILEDRRIEEAYSGMSVGGDGRYKRAFERLVDDAFGNTVDESEGKYEMAFNRLADAVFGEVSESKGSQKSALDHLLGDMRVGSGDDDDDVQNGGNADSAVSSFKPRTDSDKDGDGEEEEAPSGRPSSYRSDAIGRIRSQHPMLTFEEERKMIDEYLKRGDREGLDAELALHNIGLVLPFMHRYYATYFGDTDEMVSMGYEALMDAARAFDPTRGVKFSKYAYHFLHNKFNREKIYRPGERVSRASNSLDAKVKSAKGDSDDATYGDHGFYNDVADRSEMFGAKELRNIDYKGFIDRIYEVSELSDIERKVLKSLFDEGRTLQNAAVTLGLNSHQHVDQIRKRALGKVRNALEKRGMHSKDDVIAHSDRIDVPQRKIIGN